MGNEALSAGGRASDLGRSESDPSAAEMTSQGVFPARPAPRSYEARDAGEWAPRARYAASDIPLLLWRERWLMLAVFLVIAVRRAPPSR